MFRLSCFNGILEAFLFEDNTNSRSIGNLLECVRSDGLSRWGLSVAAAVPGMGWSFCTPYVPSGCGGILYGGFMQLTNFGPAGVTTILSFSTAHVSLRCELFPSLCPFSVCRLVAVATAAFHYTTHTSPTSSAHSCSLRPEVPKPLVHAERCTLRSRQAYCASYGGRSR